MAAARIKKGDKVIVLSGKTRARPHRVAGDAEGRQGRRGRRQHRHPSPQADPGEPAGWPGAHRCSAAHLEGCARDRRWQADPRPFRDAGWQEGPRGRQDRERRSMADYKPRMKAIYDDSIIKAMTDKFGYKNVNEIPRSRRSCSTWAWRSDAGQEARRPAASEMELIAGQKPVITKRRSRSRSSSCVKACRSV